MNQAGTVVSAVIYRKCRAKLLPLFNLFPVDSNETRMVLQIKSQDFGKDGDNVSFTVCLVLWLQG